MRFISVDGLVFDDQTACDRHEKTFMNYVEMIDGKGNPTTNPKMATVILLKNEIAADMFKKACEEAGSSLVGIDDTNGPYVWDGTEEYYFRVDSAYIEGIIKGFYRLCEEEEKRAATEKERAQKARELREIVGAEDNE
jgi:hypothetical protein